MAARKQNRTRKESPDGNELLVHELQEIHSAESQLARTLPRLAKSVDSQELRSSIEERLSQSERLSREIESALEEMDQSPGRRRNVAAEGLISDARERVQEVEGGPVLDAVLIGSLQKTEHYCIAAWGTARSLAASARESDVVKCMERAIKEGRQVDEQLTRLAEEKINPKLFAQDSDEGEESEEESASARSSGRGADGRREERASR
jgi:ferritin-like metal-binding protein YciE